MTMEKLLERIKDKFAPPPPAAVRAFEEEIGTTLPGDYREFLEKCNGGYLGGSLCFVDAAGEIGTSIHHIEGIRREPYFSLHVSRSALKDRIPHGLLCIMDDPGGNAICIGLFGERRGRLYFWDHEGEPGPNWDGTLESAGNVSLIANSFLELVDGLRVTKEVLPTRPEGSKVREFIPLKGFS